MWYSAFEILPEACRRAAGCVSTLNKIDCAIKEPRRTVMFILIYIGHQRTTLLVPAPTSQLRPIPQWGTKTPPCTTYTSESLDNLHDDEEVGADVGGSRTDEGSCDEDGHAREEGPFAAQTGSHPTHRYLGHEIAHEEGTQNPALQLTRPLERLGRLMVKEEVGRVTWWSLLELYSWYLIDGLIRNCALATVLPAAVVIATIVVKALYNLFEGRVPVDEIYGYPIFEWIVVTSFDI